MSYLNIDELKTHLYKAQIKVISGDDETILHAAVESAISEAKGYLAAYDRATIFSAEGEGRNAFLLSIIKDMAVFHYLKLCNYGADMEFRTYLYQRAIDWLKQVQKGQVSPELPLRDENGDGVPDDTVFLFGSNPKRSHHF